MKKIGAIIIFYLLIIAGCKNKTDDKLLQVTILTGKAKKDFIGLQRDLFVTKDSLNIAEVYIIKSIDSNNLPVISHRMFYLHDGIITDSTFYVNISGFDFVKPYYGSGNISINVKNNRLLQTEFSYQTDVIDLGNTSFKNMVKNKKIKVFYLSDSISSKTENIYGFLDIEFYKDEACIKKDFEACFSFTLPNLKHKRIDRLIW